MRIIMSLVAAACLMFVRWYSACACHTRSDLIGHTGENAMEHEWYTGPVYTQPYLGPAGTHNGNLASKNAQSAGDQLAGGSNYEEQ